MPGGVLPDLVVPGVVGGEITPYPVGLDEIQAHLKLEDEEFEAEQSLIEVYASAATQWAEMLNGRKFLLQACQETFDAFPAMFKPIHAPLAAVSSILYLDANGTEQTLSSSLYRLDADPNQARITPAYGCSWPSTHPVIAAVTLNYTAGYGSGNTSVPEIKRNAILRLVATLYENRGNLTPLRIEQLPQDAIYMLSFDRRVAV